MINKLKLVSIINKYYLGMNESVKWEIKDNSLKIEFMTPSKDVIGNLTCNDFELEDSKLAIYDTKKLQNLISSFSSYSTFSNNASENYHFLIFNLNILQKT